MKMSNEIKYKGARFYKCALQVNPFSYEGDFRGREEQNEDAYNRQILEQCRAHKIEVVGLADHGSVGNSQSLREYLSQNDIVVLPGFEIASSEKIHMVCLYPEDEEVDLLNQYLGQLMGYNTGDLKNERTTPSALSCQQIAEIILNEQGGFWYAAHATNKNGLLRLSGAGDNYKQLWKRSDLVIAVQIPGTVDDLEVERDNLRKYKNIIENKNLDYKRAEKISIINAKDIVKPEDLAEPSASCLVKMTQPNFQAFKDAFEDPSSRIRLNHEISSNPISKIESISWEGAGLFNDQELAFSSNLNAIIGGRGTGKSTLIESIRFALDLPSRVPGSNSAQSIQSANLKNSRVELKVCCGSQHGNKYVISRRYGEAPIVTNKEGEISQMTPRDLFPEIDLLGQNEILKITENDAEQFTLVSKFLPDTQNFSARIAEAKIKLAKNRQKIIAARKDIDAIEEKINREDMLKEQQERYKELGIEEKLKNSALLEKEKQLDDRIKGQIALLERWLEQYKDLFDLNFLQHNTLAGLPSEKLITDVCNAIEQLQTKLNELVAQVTKEIDNTKSIYQKNQAQWKSESAMLLDEINQAIARLPDHEGRSGKEIGDNYKKIIAELVSIERHKEAHKNQKKLIADMESQRRSLLDEYRTAAFERYLAMGKKIQKMNTDEFQGKIKINISRCENLSALKAFLQNLDGIGDAKIKWLDDIEEPVDLEQWSQWIRNESKDQFLNKYKPFGLTDTTVKRLFAITLERRLQLEEIEIEDTVKIQLNVAHENEKEGRYVPIESLSVGQKSTAILHLLLAKLHDPLIIDQPEDNLDNAFIAERIVSDIRNIKTKRQFLFATHNANIPVFGDAELIAVLGNKESKSSIDYIGSIDDPDIRDQATQILEGGKHAFNMRKNKYGF